LSSGCGRFSSKARSFVNGIKKIKSKNKIRCDPIQTYTFYRVWHTKQNKTKHNNKKRHRQRSDEVQIPQPDLRIDTTQTNKGKGAGAGAQHKPKTTGTVCQYATQGSIGPKMPGKVAL
jgi:hypothetical protein